MDVFGVQLGSDMRYILWTAFLSTLWGYTWLPLKMTKQNQGLPIIWGSSSGISHVGGWSTEWGWMYTPRS